MTTDASDRLKALLGTAAASRALPSAQQPTAPRLNSETFTQPQQGNTRIFYVADVTYSMAPYVQAMQRVIESVGQKTLDAQKGIEATVLGINEHERQGYTPRIIREKISSAKLHQNFLQYFDWTADPSKIRSQVAQLVLENQPNGDTAEPYECTAKYVVDHITQDKIKNPNRNYGVVFFGDAKPHGITKFDDRGCVHGVKADELETLIQVANRVYWVDCDSQGTGEFKQFTYDPLSKRETSIYLKFKDAQSILEDALVGMVKQTVSPATYNDFLATLSGTQAQQVRRLLGNGK